MNSNLNFDNNKETKIKTSEKHFVSEEEKHPGFVVTGQKLK